MIRHVVCEVKGSMMTQFQTGTKLEMSECPECLQELSLLESESVAVIPVLITTATRKALVLVSTKKPKHPQVLLKLLTM